MWVITDKVLGLFRDFARKMRPYGAAKNHLYLRYPGLSGVQDRLAQAGQAGSRPG